MSKPPVRGSTRSLFNAIIKSEVNQPAYVLSVLDTLSLNHLRQLYHSTKRKPKMSKQETKLPTNSTNPLPAVVANDEKKPRKPRSPSVKYVNIVESKYTPRKDGEKRTPLDDRLKLEFGGLRFPGVVFEANCLGFAVKIPATQTVLKDPTLRQLIEFLETVKL